MMYWSVYEVATGFVEHRAALTHSSLTPAGMKEEGTGHLVTKRW